jgi:hypothetical protein
MNRYQGFRGISAFIFKIEVAAFLTLILKIEAAGSSETLVSKYQIIRHHIPEDRNINTRL